MNKVYTRINWENYPSEKTAVNESNLNKMDSALNEIDTRVVEHETTKANVASLNELINYWHIDETTGVITIHKVSGEQIIFDLNIEKVPVGFSMTEDGILIMTTDDGTEFTANIGSMIPILTFNDSEQIAVSVSGEGVSKTYTFTIKTGSITEDKLQPNFLADCRLYAGNAENSATLAEEYAQQAKESAESVSNDAKNISFDDSVAQTGSDNVQGAIEKNSSDLTEIKNEVASINSNLDKLVIYAKSALVTATDGRIEFQTDYKPDKTYYLCCQCPNGFTSGIAQIDTNGLIVANYIYAPNAVERFNGDLWVNLCGVFKVK